MVLRPLSPFKKRSQEKEQERLILEQLETRNLLTTLQLLHASDLEGGVDAIDDAPNFAAIVEALEDDADTNGFASILLSAGDNYLSGPFFSAAADTSVEPTLREVYDNLFGLPDGSLNNLRAASGRIDVSIMNILGFDASALGNHEFDLGTASISDVIRTDIRGDSLGDVRWLGSQFPYLSANLDFSADGNLSDLFTSSILDSTDFQSLPGDLDAAADAPKIAPATLIDIGGGEKVGVIGATTQLLESISSPGDTSVIGPNVNDMQALADILNPIIAQLSAETNMIVVVSHLQQINLEQTLAGLLNGVDIIVAGGSDTLLADGTDVLRPGDTADGPYPILTTNMEGNDVAIVSTDGEYSYVGRLVVEFDASGNLIPGSIDMNQSGAYATTDAVVTSLWGNLVDPFAEGTKGGEVAKLTAAVEAVVNAKDSVIFGSTDVFLEGRRSEVRTQETNLGNLTADANLAYAQSIDPTVVVSLKNGGGIRAEIGLIDGGTGELLPPQGNPDTSKQPGDISQLDIENTLRFNNGLSLVTLTVEELRQILEHGVAASGPGSTPGQFPQVGGMAFSFDPTQQAIEFDENGAVVTQGQRIRSLVLIDEDGNITETLMKNGVVVGNPNRTLRIVTLDFLAGGGDGYPYPTLGQDRVDLELKEQDTLANFLSANFMGTPFAEAETPMILDERIQNLSVREDTLLPASILLEHLSTFETGVFDEGAAEIVTYDPTTQRLFFTNADANTVIVLDISDPSSPTQINTIDLSPYGDGVNSVDVKNGIVAVAVEADPITDPGVVAFFDVDGNFLGEITVGALPDMVTFTPDGTKVLVANEGEPDDGINPEGSISIISLQLVGDVVNPDLAAAVTNATVQTATFTAFNGQEATLRAQGVRLFDGEIVSEDLEPEYIAVSPDGTTAWVTLQEANSIAVIDIATATITQIIPLGTIDHSLPGFGLDASDRDDAINIINHPVFGLFMPDAIAAYEIGGQTYYVTANEGDDRGEDERVEDIDLDPAVFPDFAELQLEEILGRLGISSIDGNLDADGEYEQLFSYGTRSFTIWDSMGNRVFDSGSAFEQITAEMFPEFFNSSNDETEFDSRSDAKGPEPEAVTIGEIDGRIYAFVGLERIGGIMVYDITTPGSPTFVQYLNHRDFEADPESSAAGDLGVEGLKFISAADSPNGIPLLVASNEISGTVSIFQINPQDQFTLNEQIVNSAFFEVLGRIADEGGLEYWTQIYVDQGLEAVVTGLWHSAEHRAMQIQEYYQDFLNRGAEETAVEFWTTFLNAGNSEQDLIINLLGSAEYRMMFADNAEFIQGVYGETLMRSAEPGAVTFWDSSLNSGLSREAFVDQILSQVEYFDKVIDFWYNEAIGRNADEAGREHWRNALSNGASLADFAIFFYGSGEFEGNINNP
ncbi:Bifunctional metallophosphatase/5'-nucleotidase [Planctomycetales bacterium 10988]|nr:Bifunctional metallophosphatase/5'-nucleotidase [Planctomycetales bacterium 10988]